MFDWLFEGHRHPAVYILLAAAAVLFVVVAVRRRRRRWLIGTAVAAALAGLYCLLDYAVETDSEQIERKVNAMAAGFKAPANLDAVFDNVSDQFRNSAGDKKWLRDLAQQQLQNSGITDVKIIEFRTGEISREKNLATAEFRAKVAGNFGGGLEAVTVHCDANFDYDALHGWRMSGLGVKAEYPIQNVELPP
ncbi:MAG TPA: hypothetical protein VMS17_15950 [Gemmataceae bacterium]|nr:hypothetical protein [Gemmataceae bacterium]